MSENLSEVDAHVARTPDDLVDAALEAAELACRAAVHSLEAIRLMRTEGEAPRRIMMGPHVPTIPFVQPPEPTGMFEDTPRPHDPDMIGPDHPDYVDADIVDDEESTKEDRWIGTGEPAVEPPPAPAIEGAMPPDHCDRHPRAHVSHCAGCIAALEAQDTWRSSFENRAAAARAAVAAEAAAAAKPLPPGRQEFREAKAAFDAKRERATDDQKSAITVILSKRGIVDRQRVLDAIAEIVGRPITSRNDLTKADASRVIDRLNAIPLPPDSALPEADQPRTVDATDGPVGPSPEHPTTPDPRTCGMCGHDHDGTCRHAIVASDGLEEPCGCPEFTDPDYGDPDDLPTEPGPALEVPADAPTPVADDGDEFDRTRPGWRDYDTGGTYAMTTTGGPDEPIF